MFAFFFFFSSRRRHTRCALVTGVQTCALPISMATFFIPLTTLTLAGLDPHRIPAAAGLSNFVRLVFGAFGTSITTTMWENRAGLHHAQLTEAAGTEERRVGKECVSVDLGGRRILKKNTKNHTRSHKTKN